MRHRTLGALLVTAVLGCGADPVAEQRRLDSWIATARLVAAAWLDHSVPTAYARHTLATADDAVRDIATRVDAPHADGVERALGRMRDGVGASDPGAVRRAVDEIGVLQREAKS